ncbi:uncharacterized protein LOC144422212 [Styela clava]
MGLYFSRGNGRVFDSTSNQNRRHFPLVNIAFLMVGSALVAVGYTTRIGGNSLIISGFFLMAVAVMALVFKYTSIMKPRYPRNTERRTGESSAAPVYSVSANVQSSNRVTPSINNYLEGAVADNPPPYAAVAATAPPTYDEVTKVGGNYDTDYTATYSKSSP